MIHVEMRCCKEEQILRFIYRPRTFMLSCFQVLDDDFIAETECYHDRDCAGCNERFFEKCGRYDCGELARPITCDQVRSLRLLLS